MNPLSSSLVCAHNPILLTHARTTKIIFEFLSVFQVTYFISVPGYLFYFTIVTTVTPSPSILVNPFRFIHVLKCSFPEFSRMSFLTNKKHKIAPVKKKIFFLFVYEDGNEWQLQKLEKVKLYKRWQSARGGAERYVCSLYLCRRFYLRSIPLFHPFPCLWEALPCTWHQK